jgi:S-(hydroxymethyl)glutathione dehydrogenase/alcohol dehydrogenase
MRLGESALIVGLGGIGLCAVAGARLSGASQVIAADVVPEKEPLAKQLGATDFVTSGADLAKQVRKLTGGRGVDHSFECVGTAATTRLAWQSVRRGGQCTLVGVGRRGDELNINVLELFHFARNLTSSVYGSSDPDRDIPLLADIVSQGRLNLSALVSHRIGLGDIEEAFARMLNGQGARSLIIMGA